MSLRRFDEQTVAPERPKDRQVVTFGQPRPLPLPLDRIKMCIRLSTTATMRSNSNAGRWRRLRAIGGPCTSPWPQASTGVLECLKTEARGAGAAERLGGCVALLTNALLT